MGVVEVGVVEVGVVAVSAAAVISVLAVVGGGAVLAGAGWLLGRRANTQVHRINQ